MSTAPTPAGVDPAEPTLSDLAALVAAAKVMGDAVKERETAVRDRVLTNLLALNAEHGVKSIEVKIPGAGKVATLTLTEPSDKAIVADDKAFTAWIEENYPTEVEYVVQVRPAFAKTFLEKMVTIPDDGTEVLLADTETGEVQTVPGLIVRRAGAPTSMSLRFESTGRAAVAQALDGTLAKALLAADPTPQVIDAVLADEQGAA